jgi:hypothetical protein
MYLRLGRNALWVLGVIAIAMLIGMAGYMFWGKMGPAQAFADAAMILSGMGPLDRLETTGGQIFEGIYAIICGLVFFAASGFLLAPLLHRILHSFHLEDTGGDGEA